MPRENTPRRRGRPKTTGASDNAEELRREQIRSAQRTYRLRRDNRIRAMEDAHEELKAKCDAMEDALLEIRGEAARNTSSGLLAEIVLRRTAHFFGEASSSSETASSPGEPPASVPSRPRTPCDTGDPRGAEQSFGYLVSNSKTTTAPPPLHRESDASHLQSTPTSSSLIPLPQPPPCTYTPQETTFARRLHRQTLDHAYKTFTTPSSPHSIYRTFRLVPCFKDRAKMAPHFLRLLRSDAGQRLEIYGQPFYCIGGAGRHYPRVEGEVTNLRFPRRIVGIREWSEGGGRERYEERLRGMGYGGVWFDSYEVECYLKEKGVCPLAHSSVVPVRRTSSPEDEGTEQPGLETQSPSGGSKSPGGDSAATKGQYLDVDCFLERLCTTASILGRAPGFRKDSVDAAIRHALRNS